MYPIHCYWQEHESSDYLEIKFSAGVPLDLLRKFNGRLPLVNPVFAFLFLFLLFKILCKDWVNIFVVWKFSNNGWPACNDNTLKMIPHTTTEQYHHRTLQNFHQRFCCWWDLKRSQSIGSDQTWVVWEQAEDEDLGEGLDRMMTWWL